jgi:transcriptional regulator with XRE-family HTH domain
MARKREQKQRVSQIFRQRLRETRQARGGLSQGELAARMREAGHPTIDKAAVLRIEKGTRGVSLDEALALASVLNAVPAQLFTPPGEEVVWVTENHGFDGAGMRAWLLHGNEFIATASDYQRSGHAQMLERVVLAHAKALIDAHRGDDPAGVKAELAALGNVAASYRLALENRGFELYDDREEADA